MKFFCRKEIQGAISIFLVTIMLPMMVISALMVDTARYNLAKSMVSSAGDLAMGAALADYDAILKDVYGLFAMSQVDDVTENVKNYFEQTVVSHGVVSEEDAGDYVSQLLGSIYEYLLVDEKETADFLAMTMADSAVKAEMVEGSSLADPGILEKQIVEYMKYRAPVDFALSFFDSLSAFTKVEAQTDVVQAQVNAQSSLKEASDENSKLYEKIRLYDECYEKLEPEPVTDARKHLKNYGNIFTAEYMERYEKLHGLTMVFCTAAYLGKWQILESGSGAEDSFFLPNPAGDYIILQDGNYAVSGHLPGVQTSFDKNADSLNNELNQFLNGNKDSVVNTLKSYNEAGSAEPKITSAALDLSEEANWGQAISDFQKVDSFYKNNWANYVEALKQLDGYAALMKCYTEKVNAEIAVLEAERMSAQEKADKAEQKSKNLDEQIENAKTEIGKYSEEAQEDAEQYRMNERDCKEMAVELNNKHLSNTKKEEITQQISELEEQNKNISNAYKQGDNDVIATIVDRMNIKDDCEEAKENQDNISQKAREAASVALAGKSAKEAQRDAQQASYNAVMSACMAYVNCFNQDARNYRHYKEAMYQVISAQTNEISAEFNELLGNIKQIEQLVSAAETQYGVAEGAIITYTGNVETWSAENDKYVRDAQDSQKDNFSQVQSAGISEAQNVFEQEEVEALLDEIKANHVLLTQFIEEIEKSFSYMEVTQIKDITNAEAMAEAIRRSSVYSTIKSRYLQSAYEEYQYASANPGERKEYFVLPSFVEAGKLDTLKRFIKPVPCCAFMNYLHQTYKEWYENGKSDEKKNLTDEQKSDKETYDGVKKSGNLARKVEETSQDSGNKYGYQYQGITDICGEGYPSNGSGANSGTDDDGGGKNGNADQDGLASNKSFASQVLGGLGTAMENGRDKLYVTAYLFDNFSFNTIVQDRVRKDGKEPDWLNCQADLYADYVAGEGKTAFAAALTGSNYPISGLNNRIYGAEIEYVLYGNRNPSKNVTYTYASIYAIRVLFNAVYAFSSSDIRNETRAIALSVQAATCGIVPYQVVQVVLQLALAMGESAIDIKNMEAGAKVAVVKSKDTWVLSLSGLGNLAKKAAVNVADLGVKKVTKFAANKINEIVDAGAEELSEIVKDIDNDLTELADTAAEEALDAVFAQIDAITDRVMKEAIHELFYTQQIGNANDTDAKAAIKTEYHNALGKLQTEINSKIDEMKQSMDNTLVSAACEKGKNLVGEVVSDISNQLDSKVDSLTNMEDIQSFVYEEINSVKSEISQRVKKAMGEEGLIGQVSKELETKIADTTKSIKESITQEVGEITDAAKNSITEKINQFVGDDLSVGSTKMGDSKKTLADTNGNEVSSSTKASSIMFGYSDYLKLFVFIGLCADNTDGVMLKRIGDLIQLNISTAGEKSDLVHRAGEKFTLSNAKTYISLEADVELDLMFLNIGIFQNQVESFNEEYEEEDKINLGETMNIHYLGIAGY